MNAGALLHEALDEIGGLCEHLRPFQLVELAMRLAPLARDAHYTVDLVSHSSVSLVATASRRDPPSAARKQRFFADASPNELKLDPKRTSLS